MLSVVCLNRVLIDVEPPLEGLARRLDALRRNRVLIEGRHLSIIEAVPSN